jgi:hypothetical protein
VLHVITDDDIGFADHFLLFCRVERDDEGVDRGLSIVPMEPLDFILHNEGVILSKVEVNHDFVGLESRLLRLDEFFLAR